MKKLGFGLMRLPLADEHDAHIDLDALVQMVDLFLERGFTYFDTAYMYHEFQSEKAIRKALVRRYPRDRFTLATKLPVMFLKTAEDQARIFDEQLENCGVDFFDYYLLHAVDETYCETIDRLNSFAFLQQKKNEGSIRYAGFSFHDRAELLDKLLTEHPEVDFVQLQVNYLDWDNEGIQARKCYETARRHGKPIIVMEPVKGGTLAKVPEEVRTMFQAARPEMSIASWAIRFAASLDGVMTVLSGMSNFEQLQDNTDFMQNFQPLSPEEHALVDQAVQKIHATIQIPCTACRYCVEGCPQNIAIPEYFALYNAEKQADNRGFSTQSVYYENLLRTHGKASDCVACGQCERICPQKIKISDCLQKVAQAFGQ